MQLNWRTSSRGTAVYAIRQTIAARPLIDRALTERMQSAADAVRAALESVPNQNAVLDHALALSGDDLPLLEVARAALEKTAKSVDASSIVALKFAESLEIAAQAFAAERPSAASELALRVAPLRLQWEARGPGLLAGVRRLTTSELLPPAATVVLVQPLLGGSGVAHPPCQRVTFEAVLANPLAELPEVLRLGFLLAQLNSDQPSWRDSLATPAPTLAHALVPIVLGAAEDVELARCDEPRIRLALATWLGSTLGLAPLLAWWQTYRAERPDWIEALRSLDALLYDKLSPAVGETADTSAAGSEAPR